MKNKTSGKVRGGNARIAELYKNDNWNVAKAGVAREGMTVGEVCVVHKANGHSVIFICRAAMPEFVSDETVQAIKDNCTTTIILKPQFSPFRTAGEVCDLPVPPLSGMGKTVFASQITQEILEKRPKFDAATVRRGMTFRKPRRHK